MARPPPLKTLAWLFMPVLLHAGLLVAYGLLAPEVPIPDLQPRKDVTAIVLGNTVYPDGTLSDRLLSRLEGALSLWNNQQVGHILVSGATGEEGIDEAIAMATYLAQQGIPREKIWVDSHGINTQATAQNARTRLGNASPVVCVSSYYHLARCHLALERAGLKVVGVTRGPMVGEWRELYAIMREVVAFQVYFWREQG